MIWMDVRSAAEAAEVGASGDPALRINSDGRGPVSAEWMIPKSLWMMRNQPELFRRAARICEYQDYINWRLTGRWVASLNNMSVRWYYQAATAACRGRCSTNWTSQTSSRSGRP